VTEERPDIVGRHRRLVSRTILVSALTLVSRILGYARESFMAALFGHQSAVLDAFITSWRVPNLFRRLLGEGALSTSLQTRLTEVDNDLGLDCGRALLARTLLITSWILVALCLVVMAVANLVPDRLPIVGWHVLGGDPAAVRELTTRLMPFVILVCISALTSGALQVRGEFKVSSLAPAVLNVVWVATLAAFLWRDGWPRAASSVSRSGELEMMRVLSWAVLIAGVLQLLVQVPMLRRHGFMGAGATPARHPAFDVGANASKVLRASAPLALGAAVYQFNVMIDGLMAQGMLSQGGPGAYYFATRVQHFPIALIALSATSAIFPSLKALGHLGRKQELRDLHDRAQAGVLFLALPAAFGLIALAEPICALLFQHGRYGAEGVERTALTLIALSFAILPAGAVSLASRAYFAMNDFAGPVRVSIAMVAVNIGLNVLFVAALDLDAAGFAASTALTAWINIGILWPGLCRRLDLPPTRLGLPGRFARVAIGSAVSAVLARGVYSQVLGQAPPNGAWALFAMGSGVALAVAAYVALTRVMGLEEGRALLARWGRSRDPEDPAP
jgi:putative peptidoglycan lipid II flippase